MSRKEIISSVKKGSKMADEKKVVSSEQGKFIDDTDRTIDYLTGFLSYLKRERGQLYGTIGVLMRKTDTSQFHITPEDVAETMNHYSVHFVPKDGGQSVDVELHFHEESRYDQPKNEVLH